MPIASTETLPPPLTADQALGLGALTLRSQRDEDARTHVLAVDGELDIASAADVERELKRIEAAAPAANAIVIDLRGLTFVDSSGLRMLIEASSRAQVSAHRLVLRRPTDGVFRAFEICRVDTLLPFDRSDPESDA